MIMDQNERKNIKMCKKKNVDINLRSFYISCGCYSLNLVLCDMTNSCPKATSFFLEYYNAYILYFLFQQKDEKFYKIIFLV